MKDNKIKIFVIILAIVVIAGMAVYTTNKKGKQTGNETTTTAQQAGADAGSTAADADSSQVDTDSSENGGADADSSKDNKDNKDSQDGSGNSDESTSGILENEGDLEIIVPDAQETTGE